MRIKKSLAPVAAGLCVLACSVASSVNGALIYTSQSAFQSVLASGSYLETFESLGAGGLGVGSMNFSGGTPTFTYTITAVGDELWGLTDSGLPSGQAISTTTPDVNMVITFTSGNVTAVGGDFFLTDWDESRMAGTLRVTLNDGTYQDLNSYVSGTPDFVGFTTDISNPITSLTFNPVSGSYASLDNLRVGAVVPEPVNVAMGIFGLGLVGVTAGRRYLAKRSSKA